MSNKNYLVPDEMLEKVLLVKKSRFIACATKIECRDDAKSFLQLKKLEYSDARHHCWAYLIGNPQSASFSAMNDDGEPSGTAGKPILNVIQHKDIGDVMVLVTRYFGGIKLGAGGLTRAYSGVTELVLSQLKMKQQIAMSEILISCDFSQEQMLRHWASQNNAMVQLLEYSNRVEMKLKLPINNIAVVEAYCLANNIMMIK